MKKIYQISLALLASLFTIATNGQNWLPLGPNDFDQPTFAFEQSTALVLDAGGTPYMAYSQSADEGSTGQLSVRKFDGTKWAFVGPSSFSANGVGYIAMAIDATGNPVVAYCDYSVAGKISVKKFDGSNWVTLGLLGFSAGQVQNVSVVITTAGVPYVTYSDNGNADKIMVKRFNGTAWETVGGASVSAGKGQYPILAISATNVLYVAYSDNTNSDKARVKKLNGSAWEDVGAASASEDAVLSPFNLVIASDGTPYLAYNDGDLYGSHNGRVKKFNGTTWQLEGGVISVPVDKYLSPLQLTVSAAGVPYLAYSTVVYVNSRYLSEKMTVQKFTGLGWENVEDVETAAGASNYAGGIALNSAGDIYLSYANKPGDLQTWTVKKYDGTDWQSVGSSGISDGASLSTQLVIDGAGVPYIAYTENYTGNKVKKYNGTGWDEVGTLGVGTGTAAAIRLAIDNSGVPYVSYQDGVKKFDGTVWQQVGSPSVVGDVATSVLATDPSGTPYLATISNIPLVRKYNGTQWVLVGGVNISDADAADMSFAIGPTGTPYIAFMDDADDNVFGGEKNILKVKKFDGSSWVELAGLYNGGYPASAIRLAVDANDVPYIAYGLQGYESIAVSKFAAGNWQELSAIEKGYLEDIAFDAGGNVTIAYNLNGGYWPVLNVKKYDGVGWVTVGEANITAGRASGVSLAIGSGKTLIAYSSGRAFAKELSDLPLPTGILDFSAVLQNNIAQLNWQATNEENVSYYNVQFSTDGALFTTIGKKQVLTGPGAISHYSFPSSIAANASGRLYFRLQVVAKGGGITYSKIQILSLDKKAGFVLSPNPAKGQFYIVPNADFQLKNSVLTLTDIAGRQVIKRTITSNSQQIISVHGFAKGMYTANIFNGTNVFQQKIIIE